MKFQLLVKTKMLALKLSDAVFIKLINAKMPTIVGILTFISRINFIVSRVEHKIIFIVTASHYITYYSLMACGFMLLIAADYRGNIPEAQYN